MFQIPSFIDTFLNENSFEFIDLIQESEWKKTYIIKIKKDKKYFILKAFSNESPDTIKHKFNNEVQFYKNTYREYVPKTIINDRNMLVLEYIDGITLRESLINNSIDFNILNNIIDLTLKIYTDNAKIGSNTYNFSNAYSHLSALIQSGPFQTKNMKIPFYIRIRNKVVLQFLKLRLSYLLKKIDTIKLKNGFVHGDFHYNNILISKNSEIKFIDFENISFEGFFDFDILYLVVMIEVYLNKEELVIFQEKINEFIKKELILQDILNLYRVAISMNEKFRSTIEESI